MNKMRILVMYANEYDVDGNKGTTINYFFYGENGEMITPHYARNGSIGYQRAKVSLPADKRVKVKTAPALYDAEFTYAIGSDGKPTLKVVDLDYAGEVSFVANYGDKLTK